jgi:DNA (cytosine-5)-methyltransferase 1
VFVDIRTIGRFGTKTDVTRIVKAWYAYAVISLVTATITTPVIPVVDLFAGPGGLAEGFAAFGEDKFPSFDVRLSIEKETAACATLEMRKYFRQFKVPPQEFDAYFAGQLSRHELFSAYPAQAKRAQDATWQAELGKEPAASVACRVRGAIGARRDWVLLGGPPCQAYSIAGRARMRSTREDFEKDERHFLYQEYLRIVADHEPAVFVMENVKGLLTSKHEGGRIVSKILDDLSSPRKILGQSGNSALRYHLYALGRRQAVLPWMEEGPSDGEEFLLKAEQYGIPQNRHRIFIVGVRSDVPGRPRSLEPKSEVHAGSVLDDLPPIRSVLSREQDSLQHWREAIHSVSEQAWMSKVADPELGRIVREMKEVSKRLLKSKLSTGTPYSKHSASPSALGDWYRHNARGLTHHESRSHMRDDLHRYLFCACFSKIRGRSPKLRDFPKELIPSHRNISATAARSIFEDRFKVQLQGQPSTTITSHVSKDGHYYIHYDPEQCRSLTVREAARLQTFPDSYFFEGNRTEQYHQVGNAVPPLLAREIASVVFDLLAASNKRVAGLSAVG